MLYRKITEVHSKTCEKRRLSSKNSKKCSYLLTSPAPLHVLQSNAFKIDSKFDPEVIV